MAITTLVQFSLAELDLEAFPDVNSRVQVSGGGTTGLPISFKRDVIVHSHFKHNQNSEEGIFGIIRWDYFERQQDKDLCLARGLFSKPKTEVKWISQLDPASFRAMDGFSSAVLFVASPFISTEKINDINLEYQESQKTQDIDDEPDILVWEPFQSSRQHWAPIDYAAEFERTSMNSDTKEVRTSRADLFFIADKQTAQDGSILAVFMLNQDPITLDPVRLLRYSPSDAALMGMSLFTVGFERANPDEWPQNPQEVARLEEVETGSEEQERGFEGESDNAETESSEIGEDESGHQMNFPRSSEL